MRNLHCLFLASLLIATPLFSISGESIEIHRQEEKSSSWISPSTLKVISTIVGIGACLSFAFWLPSTLNVIRRHGVPTAITETYIPRLALDVGTIVVAKTAYDYANLNSCKTFSKKK